MPDNQPLTIIPNIHYVSLIPCTDGFNMISSHRRFCLANFKVQMVCNNLFLCVCICLPHHMLDVAPCHVKESVWLIYIVYLFPNPLSSYGLLSYGNMGLRFQTLLHQSGKTYAAPNMGPCSSNAVQAKVKSIYCSKQDLCLM